MGLCSICAQTIKNEPAGAECSLCRGLFGNLEALCGMAVRKAEGYEWSTFSLGCRIPKNILTAQEALWLERGLENSRSIKNIINEAAREFILSKTGKKYSPRASDVLFLLDFERNSASAQISPVFVFSHYKKYSREISQSIWHCKKCAGSGRQDSRNGEKSATCEKCKGKGVMYESVEGIIGAPIRRAFEGEETAFHASGREDIDAVMRGSGRPFAIEVKNPRKRKADMRALQAEINKDARIRVPSLSLVSQHFVKVVCSSHFEKEYEAEVSLEREIAKADLKKILSLSGKTILQETPTRVLHRRADLQRKRKIISISARGKGKTLTIRIRAQAGTYIKELVSSDNGRTKPSVSGILRCKAVVEKLDVVKIHDEFLRGVSKK